MDKGQVPAFDRKRPRVSDGPQARHEYKQARRQWLEECHAIEGSVPLEKRCMAALLREAEWRNLVVTGERGRKATLLARLQEDDRKRSAAAAICHEVNIAYDPARGMRGEFVHIHHDVLRTRILPRLPTRDLTQLLRACKHFYLTIKPVILERIRAELGPEASIMTFDYLWQRLHYTPRRNPLQFEQMARELLLTSWRGRNDYFSPTDMVVEACRRHGNIERVNEILRRRVQLQREQVEHKARVLSKAGERVNALNTYLANLGYPPNLVAFDAELDVRHKSTPLLDAIIASNIGWTVVSASHRILRRYIAAAKTPSYIPNGNGLKDVVSALHLPRPIQSRMVFLLETHGISTMFLSPWFCKSFLAVLYETRCLCGVLVAPTDAAFIGLTMALHATEVAHVHHGVFVIESLEPFVVLADFVCTYEANFVYRLQERGLFGWRAFQSPCVAAGANPDVVVIDEHKIPSLFLVQCQRYLVIMK